MHAVFSEAHRQHQPSRFIRRGEWADYPEVPERAENLVAAAAAAGLIVTSPDDFAAAPREAVHDARHLAFLATAHERWSAFDGASEYLVPNTHPVRHRARYPRAN